MYDLKLRKSKKGQEKWNLTSSSQRRKRNAQYIISLSPIEAEDYVQSEEDLKMEKDYKPKIEVNKDLSNFDMTKQFRFYQILAFCCLHLTWLKVFEGFQIFLTMSKHFWTEQKVRALL